MLRCGTTRKLLYSTGEWTYVVCSAGFVLMEALNNLAPGTGRLESRPIVSGLIGRLQELSFPIFLFLSFLVLLAVVVRRMADPWIVEKLKYILDEYQVNVFRNGESASEPLDYNRVTLFKYKKRCLFVRHWSATSILEPWGKAPFMSDYLIPVLRSGHISQKSKSAFHAPDSSDAAEGVVGRAWASKRAVVVTRLPAIESSSQVRNIAQYCRETAMQEAMLKKYIDEGRPIARSFVAIPVERKGEVWGVVVLDSRSPNGLSSSAVENYRLTVALIGNLLERVR